MDCLSALGSCSLRCPARYPAGCMRKEIFRSVSLKHQGVNANCDPRKIPAIVTMAPKFSSRFSCRVAILRNCFSLAKSRSTRLRVRSTSWSKTPLCRSLFLCGIVTAMPCFRRYERNLRLLYPLSATKRFGYRRLLQWIFVVLNLVPTRFLPL